MNAFNNKKLLFLFLFQVVAIVTILICLSCARTQFCVHSNLFYYKKVFIKMKDIFLKDLILIK